MHVEPGQQLPLIEDDLSYLQTIFNNALNSGDVVKFLGTLWKRKEYVLRLDFLELAPLRRFRPAASSNVATQIIFTKCLSVKIALG